MSSFAFPFAGPLGGDTLAPVEAVVTVDHIANALGRLRQQFRSAAPMQDVANRTDLEKLLAALLSPAADLELALQQLLQLRGLPVATGVWLDVIGRIVGQERGALVDDDYRRFLSAKVATNRSAGKRRDLIKIAKLVLNDPNAVIVVRTEQTATTIVRVDGAFVSDDLADILVLFLTLAVAAGIRLVLETDNVDPTTIFTFDTGPGFDTGHFANGRE